jgi:hypothetical protein
MFGKTWLFSPENGSALPNWPPVGVCGFIPGIRDLIGPQPEALGHTLSEVHSRLGPPAASDCRTMYRLGACRRYVLSSALGCNTCQANVGVHSVFYSRKFAVASLGAKGKKDAVAKEKEEKAKSKTKKPAASSESKKKKGGKDESKSENEALYNFMHAAEDAKR